MPKNLEKALTDLWRISRFTSYFFQSVHFFEYSQIPTLALTAYSSRMTLFYNRDFIESLDSREIIGLLVHEMFHIIMNHDHRAYPDEDTGLQNIAQDMVVNDYLYRKRDIFFSRRDRHSQDTPRLVLPAGLPRIPEQFRRETGKNDPAWEELYRWLKNRKKTQITPADSGDGMDSGMEGESDSGDSTPENPFSLPEAVKHDSADRNFTNMEGFLFNDDQGDPLATGMHMLRNHDLKNEIDSSRKKIISFAERDSICMEERVYHEITAIIRKINKTDITSWRHILKSIVDFKSQSNEWKYTYGRFNRRYFSEGIYSPGRVFRNLQEITVAVDVSGSMVMNPSEIESAFGVIEELLVKYRVSLLCIDEDLFIPEKRDDRFIPSSDRNRPYYYKKGDWQYLRTGARGTTFFAPLFNDYMTGHREVLLVITDGYIYDIEKLRTYSSTVWVLSGNRPYEFNAPFGQTVTMTSGT